MITVDIEHYYIARDCCGIQLRGCEGDETAVILTLAVGYVSHYAGMPRILNFISAKLDQLNKTILFLCSFNLRTRFISAIRRCKVSSQAVLKVHSIPQI